MEEKMSVDWSRWTPEHVELVLLASFFHARHSPGYRRRDEKLIGASVDWETGYEHSEADLLSPGEALMGPAFVFKSQYMPDACATNILLRDEADGTTTALAFARAVGIVATVPDPEQPDPVPGQKAVKDVVLMRRRPTERASVEDELERVQREHPEWNPRIKDLQGREAWDEEEARAVAEMTYRFQRAFLRFSQKGWMRLGPSEVFVSGEGSDYNRDLYSRGVDDSGLPFAATVTPDGLDEAERRIPGTPLARAPFWGVEARGTDVRSRAMAESPWVIERAKGDAAGAV